MVYSKPDGTFYINWMGGKKPIELDEGTFRTQWKIYSIVQTKNPLERILSILGAAQF